MQQPQVTFLPRGLRAWRNQRGLTQETLAELTRALDPEDQGISATLIALIETGKRQPSLSNALLISDALDIELEAVAFVHGDLEAFLAERPAPTPAPTAARRRWQYDDTTIRAAAAAVSRRSGRGTFQHGPARVPAAVR